MSDIICFDKLASLVTVTHNGTCFLSCIAAATQSDVISVANQFIALKKMKTLTSDVRNWARVFEEDFICYQNGVNKVLRGRSYVTSPALQAFADVYKLVIVVVNSVVDESRRRNLVKIIAFHNCNDSLSLLVLNADGQKFDYWVPKRESDKTLFTSLVIETAMVSFTSFIWSMLY